MQAIKPQLEVRLVTFSFRMLRRPSSTNILCIVIRGLALGTLNEKTQKQFLLRELKMAGALSGILSIAGFGRAIVFQTPFAETVAVTSALMLIVFSSICLGAVLPLLLKKIGVDPAHSSTTIQVNRGV